MKSRQRPAAGLCNVPNDQVGHEKEERDTPESPRDDVDYDKALKPGRHLPYPYLVRTFSFTVWSYVLPPAVTMRFNRLYVTPADPEDTHTVVAVVVLLVVPIVRPESSTDQAEVVIVSSSSRADQSRP